MLFYSSSGCKYSKRTCNDVVEWFVMNYLPRYKIDITIHHRGMLRDGVFGWVGVLDCDYRPREFEIEIHNRLTPKDYIQTLLHELWHVYQHVKGDLKDKHGIRLWKGADHSATDYDDQPWEKQAHLMEKILYNQYLTKCLLK